MKIPRGCPFFYFPVSVVVTPLGEKFIQEEMRMNDFSVYPGMIRICIEADQSYQIKRILKAIEGVKGLEMMKTTGTRPNKKRCTRLFSGAVFRDDKYKTKKS